MSNSVAVNVLGTIGTVFWCVQLVPQIIRNYLAKQCEGVPPIMMFLWATSGIPFAIYFIGSDGSIPLRIQPELFTFFCFISWLQTLYYPPTSMELKKVILYGSLFVAVAVGLETGFILWLRPLFRRDIKWPMLIIGIVASVLLAVGLIPPYFELAKRKGRVVGINFIFLTMDSLGALFSMISIIVGTMDVLSMVLYAIVLAMEFGIFVSHFIWYLRFGRHKEILNNDNDNDNVELSISRSCQEDKISGCDCDYQSEADIADASSNQPVLTEDKEPQKTHLTSESILGR